MLYIVSQNRMRLTELKTVSVITPEHDREDEGVYKILVNGMDFGHYEKKWQVEGTMCEIKEFIHNNTHGLYELPKGR